MKKIFFAVSLTAMLSACAATSTMTAQEKDAAYLDYIAEHQLESVDKVRSFTFKDWQSLSDKHLLVSTSLKKHYLLGLKHSCADLKFSQGIAVNRTSNSSLMAKFDSVTALRAPEIKCYIKSIHPVNKEQAMEIAAIGKPAESSEI
ncbi:hypothetical protein SG34_011425 [Thalassomonas viridans]|uniref:Lipoprotein n=1 Tax=Thalassomonas viridans TaxID=137584 RepID=A0AAF0CBV9_9GAMM|nr:DUF6491 family protein [Thalassomonas viridans]WDE07440.1 hypothetical protein SG34_011425 [Thalassomonas viridans]